MGCWDNVTNFDVIMFIIIIFIIIIIIIIIMFCGCLYSF